MIINFDFEFLPVGLISPVRLLILAVTSPLYDYSLPYVYSRPKSIQKLKNVGFFSYNKSTEWWEMELDKNNWEISLKPLKNE